MLVLTRKLNQRIRIGENVVLTVVEAAKGKVRIGIEAPPEVPIVREELLTRPTPDTRHPTPLPSEAA